MTFTAAAPVLAVRDLDREATWYVEVLGAVRDDPAPGWAFLHLDAVTVMLGHCPGAIPARDLGDHSSVAYLWVDDVDGCHARAVAAGARVLKPPTTEWHGMRELLLRSPEGFRLMLGQLPS